MSRPSLVPEKDAAGQNKPGMDTSDGVKIPIPDKPSVLGTLTTDLANVLQEASCPSASLAQDNQAFEAFLAELSTTFVAVAASQVDSHIESALQRLVELLDIDRSGFAQLSADGKQFVVTHSFQLPRVSLCPLGNVEAHFPWYANKVFQGEVFRLPDDLPPEAIEERAYCAEMGLKSNVTIPLKVGNAIVGGIGFASFRSHCDWPDKLIRRLRLVGDIFTNALARKRADEALKRATDQARILRDELAHATRLELVSHLTVSIAHEVNQPLCAIASNAQTAIDLLEVGEIEEVKQALQDIWGDARRGSEVIGRIRNMVKKEEPCRIPTRLDSLIEEVAPLLRREAAAKGVVLRIDVVTKDLSVVCDRVQLQQVVVNLVLNAVEAVGDGSVGPPVVQIRAEWENKEWAHVWVADSGIGLSPEDRERVFAPFFTTKPKGLGMGLAISRSIVEAHGGSIWATRGAEHGSTFHVRLPASCESRP
jgi:signal transduction histidine kinase